MAINALHKQFKEDAYIFENVMIEAKKAAEAAGDKWIKDAEQAGPKYAFYSADLDGKRTGPNHYMLDVCGFAWIKFKDRRSRFYKMAREWQLGDQQFNSDFIRKTMYKQFETLRIQTKHSVRQEMGLAEACMKAACVVINEAYPNSVFMQSRID